MILEPLLLVRRLAIRAAQVAVVAFASMPQPLQLGPQNLLALAAQVVAAHILGLEADYKEQHLRELEDLPHHHRALAAVAAAPLLHQMPTPQPTGQTQGLVALAPLALSSSLMLAKENR